MRSYFLPRNVPDSFEALRVYDCWVDFMMAEILFFFFSFS